MRTLVVPASALTFINGGGRDVDAARVSESLFGGEHIMLVDDGGNEVALAIADPENVRLRVMATPADGFAKIDGALLGWRIERALKLRTQLGLPGPDHAYRLVHGAGDGLPGGQRPGQVAQQGALGKGDRAGCAGDVGDGAGG